MNPMTATDWMAQLPGSTFLSSLAIPGTHDTMTSPCGDPYYRTQDLTLPEQLEAGVRFVDLRLTRDMVAAHREWISDITFAEIQQMLAAFLHSHPGESVIARIQNANEAKDDYGLYADALQAALDSTGTLLHSFGSAVTWPAGENPPWPRLDQIRGKVVAIECSPPKLGVSCIGTERWAADWHDNSRVRIQDEWDGPSIEDKLAAITALATSGPKEPGVDADGVLALNHISATNGAPGNPHGYSEQLNPAAARLLSGLAHAGLTERGLRGSGVYIFDFINAELADAVIAVNSFKACS